MSITLSHKKSDSNYWRKEEDVFTTDQVIQAYLKGLEDGQNANFKVLINQFKNNLKEAQKISESLIEKASHKRIELKEIHLKADSILNFEALFIADEKDFISDTFRDVYTCAREIKNDVQNENFYISFSFMPSSKHLNIKRLNADGYFYKYVNRE